jgi:outer membrane receptor protein involved in Fe transport
LTVGLRYTWDVVDFRGQTFIGGTDILLPGGAGSATASSSTGTPTWRVSLDHKFTPDILGYVSYNRGAKADGYGLAAIPQIVNATTGHYLGEKVDAFEGGFKTELLDRRVRFNVDGFYYDYRNIQLVSYVGANAIISNGPPAKIYGAEFDLEARPTENLTINGGLSLLHTEISNFPGAPNTCHINETGMNDSGGFFCDPVTGAPQDGMDGEPLRPYNAKGNQLPYSPHVTANIGFVYAIPTTYGRFLFAASEYYTSGNYFAIDNRLKQGAYGLLNASLIWTDRSDRISIRLWGKNLTNKYYYVQEGSEAGFTDFGSPGAPRQFGVALGYKF